MHPSVLHPQPTHPPSNPTHPPTNSAPRVPATQWGGKTVRGGRSGGATASKGAAPSWEVWKLTCACTRVWVCVEERVCVSVRGGGGGGWGGVSGATPRRRGGAAAPRRPPPCCCCAQEGVCVAPPRSPTRTHECTPSRAWGCQSFDATTTEPAPAAAAASWLTNGSSAGAPGTASDPLGSTKSCWGWVVGGVCEVVGGGGQLGGARRRRQRRRGQPPPRVGCARTLPSTLPTCMSTIRSAVEGPKRSAGTSACTCCGGGAASMAASVVCWWKRERVWVGG